MPVTIKIARHAANLTTHTPASSTVSLFRMPCGDEHSECKDIIQSSFMFEAETELHSSPNGFILGAVEAYSGHHHLLIRPEDIWFAILTQLSILIKKYHIELGGKFLNHEIARLGIRYTVSVAEEMTHLLHQYVTDPELRRWVMPAFTTTGKKDEIVASILMMGVIQKYVIPKIYFLCGIPSVTLLGERTDWEDILGRLEMLKTFGDESTQWYHLLKPVLSRFVTTFDTPEIPEVSDFWARMLDRQEGSNVDEISGWLTAFCLWDEDGRLLYKPAPALSPAEQADRLEPFIFWVNKRPTVQDLCLDGQTYGCFDMKNIPRGYASVPIIYNEYGHQFEAVMLAGSLGIQFSSSGKMTDKGEFGLDTIQAASGWFLYEKEGRKKREAEKRKDEKKVEENKKRRREDDGGGGGG